MSGARATACPGNIRQHQITRYTQHLGPNVIKCSHLDIVTACCFQVQIYVGRFQFRHSPFPLRLPLVEGLKHLVLL